MIGNGGKALIGRKVQAILQDGKKGPPLTINDAKKTDKWIYTAQDAAGFLEKEIAGDDPEWVLQKEVEKTAVTTVDRVVVPFTDVEAAAGGENGGKVKQTLCTLVVTRMSIDLIVEGHESVGHIRGPVGEDKVAAVETVNVDSRFRGYGLGRLLAAAYYAKSIKEGATKVKLGTQDTSGGFWGHLGVSLAPQTFESAKESLGTIKVAVNLKPQEAKMTDYKKRVIY